MIGWGLHSNQVSYCDLLAYVRWTAVFGRNLLSAVSGYQWKWGTVFSQTLLSTCQISECHIPENHMWTWR